MTFEKRLAARTTEIDTALTAALDRAASARVGAPQRLAEAMRHAVMSGGKRIRPFLVIETAVMLGAAPTAAMPVATALELVHCYSLVHDDLPAMDNDTLRRGKPTVWAQFDDWTAILAGDALLTLAFEQLGVDMGHRGAARQLALVKVLAEAAGARGMVGGQVVDLEADKLGQPARPTARHIQQLQAMKTGALFRFACQAGAMIADAPEHEVLALTRFGTKLGAAFQLADDLLDALGDAETVGKATAKDAAAGKATLVGLLGIDAARGRLADLEADAWQEIAQFGARADVLRETLHFACAREK